jgi:hypothetical protein
MKKTWNLLLSSCSQNHLNSGYHLNSGLWSFLSFGCPRNSG